MGACGSFLRQEGGENLERERRVIPIAVGAPVPHTNRVLQALDETPLHLGARRAIRRAAGPVPVDQRGKLLKRPEPLPREVLLPPGEELPCPALAARGPELPEFFREPVGGGQPLVGSEQFPERAVTGQRVSGAVREARRALALDEGPVRRRPPRWDSVRRT